MINVIKLMKLGTQGQMQICKFEFEFDDASSLPIRAYQLDLQSYLIADGSTAKNMVTGVTYEYANKKWNKKVETNDVSNSTNTITANGAYTVVNNVYTGTNDLAVESKGDGNAWFISEPLDDFKIVSHLNSKIVNVPDGVTGIGRLAFSYGLNGRYYSSPKFEQINFPSTLEKLDDYALSGVRLSYINIPDSVTTMGQHVFDDCMNLKSFRMPPKVTTLPSYTFYKCVSLEDCDISNVTGTIGELAFYGCTSLKNITIPTGVTAIGRSVFSGCASLKSMTIPDNVTNIGESMFYGCSELEHIQLPSTFTTITNNMFRDCPKLDVENDIDFSKITSIGTYAFRGSSIETLTTYSGLTSIGEGAFSECTDLETISMADTTNNYTLGMSVFENCTSLKNVRLSGKIKILPNKCFNGCTSLEQFTVPDGTITINNNCFGNCTNLAAIYIPKSVTTIGSSTIKVFNGCPNLTKIYIQNGSQLTVPTDKWGATNASVVKVDSNPLT